MAQRKTGTTPIPTDGALRQVRRVHNIMEVKTVLVDFTDGHGEDFVKVGFILGNEVRFLDGKLSRPAQSWLASAIIEGAEK